MQLDTSTPFGQRVERRLRDEPIIWLTTVRADGLPQPVPVWFLWDGTSALIYSQPNTPKLRNIARQPKVALNFDGDGRGGNIIIFQAEAHVAPDAPPADAVPAYLEQYAEGLKRIGLTPEQFARRGAQLCAPTVRVTPTREGAHSCAPLLTRYKVERKKVKGNRPPGLLPSTFCLAQGWPRRIAVPIAGQCGAQRSKVRGPSMAQAMPATGSHQARQPLAPA